MYGDNNEEMGGEGEINEEDGRVWDEGGEDLRWVVWRIGDKIGEEWRKKRIVKDIDDEMMKEGKGLGRKKDKSIEEGKRGRKREKKKNERWVKRWNEEKEEKRMEKRNRNDERIVGGDDIECDMSCEWWGLEKYIGEKMKVEKRNGEVEKV